MSKEIDMFGPDFLKSCRYLSRTDPEKFRRVIEELNSIVESLQRARASLVEADLLSGLAEAQRHNHVH